MGCLQVLPDAQDSAFIHKWNIKLFLNRINPSAFTPYAYFYSRTTEPVPNNRIKRNLPPPPPTLPYHNQLNTFSSFCVDLLSERDGVVLPSVHGVTSQHPLQLMKGTELDAFLVGYRDKTIPV